MQRDTLIAIGSGLGSAVLFLVVLTGHPIAFLLSYFGHLPLFLTGLWQGPKRLLVAAIAACGALILLGGLLPFTIFLIVFAGPAMLLTRMALVIRKDQNGNLAFLPSGIVVSVVVVMVALIMAFIIGTLAAEGVDLQELIGQFLRQMYSTMGVPVSSDVEGLIGVFQTYFPAVAAVSWLLMLFANAAIAQAILVRAGKNLRPSPKMANFALPGWSLFAFALAGFTVGFADGSLAFLARNVAVVLAVPFLFQGLALVHGQAARWPQKRVILTVFYIVAVLSTWSYVAITGLGIVEHLIRLRGKEPMTRSNEEDR
ncbi:YybS family protein [Thalassospira sp. MA62]|nr:YybS family protein [Thalassospira sp. MA62]